MAKYDDYLRVTQILSIVNTGIQDYLKRFPLAKEIVSVKAQFGTHVHELNALWLNRVLHADDLSEKILTDMESGYDQEVIATHDQFRRWIYRSVDEIYAVELPVISHKYKFRGTLDLVAKLKGDDNYSVIDVKTPATASLSWFLQVSAYRQAFIETVNNPIDRVLALMVSPDGVAIKESDEPINELFTKFLYCKKIYEYFKRS